MACRHASSGLHYCQLLCVRILCPSSCVFLSAISSHAVAWQVHAGAPVCAWLGACCKWLSLRPTCLSTIKRSCCRVCTSLAGCMRSHAPVAGLADSAGLSSLHAVRLLLWLFCHRTSLWAMMCQLVVVRL
jgi:hypothetical protein